MLTGSACKKEEPKTLDPTVIYFLTLKEKTIIEQFSHGTLHFIDTTGTIIEFSSDGIKDTKTYSPSEGRRGELLSLYYTCQSGYLPTFKIGYQLEAISDTTSQISIVNISGWLNQPSELSYYASFFAFKVDPANQDSLFSYIPNFTFNIFDTVHLSTGNFFNVYYLKVPKTFGLGPLTNYWYFNINYGIIGFENIDGRFWSLIKN